MDNEKLKFEKVAVKVPVYSSSSKSKVSVFKIILGYSTPLR